MKRFLVCAFVILLSGCVQAPPATVTPDLTFDNVPPVNLNVKTITVVDEYQPPLKDPNIEQNYSLSPAEAVKRLIGRQLVAAGTDKTLRVVIEDAAVIKQKLPTTEGFWGHFTQEPDERLAAHLALRFEVINDDAPDLVIAHARVEADRNRSILKDASPAERDGAFFGLTEELMKDMRESFDTNVRNTFAHI